MTQQFKFGDRVQDTEGRQFIFLRGHLSCCTVASSDGGTHVYLLNKIYPCATEPHPDTSRLDWLADPENTISKVMLPGWYSGEYDSLRDAIDAAMRIQAAKAV
jgi:hypothetical protein